MRNLMHLHPADLAVIAMVAAPAVAVGGPIEFNPVTVGIMGAVIASMRKNSAQLEEAMQTWRKATVAAGKWVTTLLSGASATVFGSPAICASVGLEGHVATLTYFGVGLIGSTLVDLVISRDKLIAEKLMEKLTGEGGKK
jgi:hypothetical protein